jgi:hypothetical protein
MNEGGGDTVADLSGNGNTGTFTNTPTWTSGNYGPAIDFAGGGADQHIAIPHNPTHDITSQITLISYAYPHNDNAAQGLIVKMTYTVAWGLYLATTGRFQVRMYIGGSLEEALSPTNVFAANNWYQFAATYDGANICLYLNGVSVLTQPASGAIGTSTGDLDFGIRGLAIDYNGLQSNNLVYNRALTAGEIGQIYRDPFCMLTKQPTELYVSAPAPAGGGQVIMIMSSIPALLIVGLCVGLACCGRKRAA